MTRWCNRKGDTVETVVTIYLGCVFQVCLRKTVILKVDDEDVKQGLQAEYAVFSVRPPLELRNNEPLCL